MNEIILIKFIILYFFNLLLDYPLQGEFLAKGKSDSNYLLWVHSAIWGLGLSIVLIPLGLFTWTKCIMLVLGHFIIDHVKAHHEYDVLGGDENKQLYVDQALHILQLIACLI